MCGKPLDKVELPQMGVKFLTLEETAKISGLGCSTINRLTKDGVFPPKYKIGGASRGKAKEVEAWCDDYEKERYEEYLAKKNN